MKIFNKEEDSGEDTNKKGGTEENNRKNRKGKGSRKMSSKMWRKR